MSNTTMTRVLHYEDETCTRCGGSGHYSRCEMYGTTCFKCRGRGRAFTKAGAKAAEQVRALKRSLTEKTGAQLAVGDVVKGSGTVTSVRVTAEPCGWSRDYKVAGPAPKDAHGRDDLVAGTASGHYVVGAWKVCVAFDGGAEQVHSTCSIFELPWTAAAREHVFAMAATLPGVEVRTK